MKKLVKNVKKEKERQGLYTKYFIYIPLGHSEEVAFLSKGTSLAQFS